MAGAGARWEDMKEGRGHCINPDIHARESLQARQSVPILVYCTFILLSLLCLF